MTRYARAKGSKASNEKLPEEATPWAELKRKATHKFDSNKEPKNDEINWKQVIKREKKLNENLNSIWCDFKDDVMKKSNSLEQNSFPKMNSKIKLGFDGDRLKVKNSKKCNDGHPLEGLMQADIVSTEEKKGIDLYSLSDENPSEQGVDVSMSTRVSEVVENSSLPAIGKPSPHLSNFIFKGSKNWSLTGKEFRKVRFQSQSHKRRKQDAGDQCIDINGQKVIVTRLDGFYIRKEDAIRIKKLEKDLLKRGVSKEEVRAVVKKERRISEKALARQKKKVCFHCRIGGHNLSSCPSLVENGAINLVSGICYKCGSTEHSHLECRASTGFKFAKCFICHQEGHISRECPDNPRGLYPMGGGCKLCGDVTHFRRDCPNSKVKENVTLGVIEDYIEPLPENESTSVPDNNYKKKKIIKFK